MAEIRDKASSDYWRELEAIAKRNNCHCGEKLEVAWGGFYGLNEHILRCKNGHINEQTVREPTLWELWQRGQLDDPYIADKMKKKELRRMAEAGVDTKALEKYQAKAGLTKVEAREVILAIWKDAPQEKREQAAILCADYGLHPLKKHVFLVEFKGKRPGWELLMGIGAKRLIASRSGPISYIDHTPRLMTDEEQTKIRGKVDRQNYWAITTVQDPRTGATASGYGYYPKQGGELIGGGEIEQGSYGKGNSRENMAMIRSEGQALDRLRPGEMPGNMQVADEAFMPEITVTQPIATAHIDEETGEILDEDIEDAEYQEVAESQEEQTPQEQRIAEILRKCPKHDIAWFEHEQYGRLHDKAEGGKCYLRQILGKEKDRIMAEMGKIDKWLNEHIKAEYDGKTWSGITDEQRLEILETKLQEWAEEA